MTFKLTTPQSDIDAFFDKYMANVEAMVIRNLCAVGEACINKGRSTDSYTDQTGNLRNSIGYVVIVDGTVINENSANEHSKKFIDELVGKSKKGVYLIVVAGMKYSASVSAKGYDVLDSAELEAEKLMEQLGFTKK